MIELAIYIVAAWIILVAAVLVFGAIMGVINTIFFKTN
jgi:hypothetical protein